jgi:hypothetical protein
VNSWELNERLRSVIYREMPLPAGGRTAERLRLLVEIAREDLSLAKLAEAHWDAIAILSEAGRTPEPDAVYAVWASEIPGKDIRLEESGEGYRISGTKPFCSGIGIADRALMTAGDPTHRLVDVDLRLNRDRIISDLDSWKVEAFGATQTGAVTFEDAVVTSDGVIGDERWYLDRPGFWHGACGPAACWVGGVAGLVDFATASKRDDPHTLATLRRCTRAFGRCSRCLTGQVMRSIEMHMTVDLRRSERFSCGI